MKVINCQTLGDMCEFMLDGEPVFLIRAQDKAAADVVKQYIALTIKYSGKNVGRSTTQLNRIRKWQEENPHRLKSAD